MIKATVKIIEEIIDGMSPQKEIYSFTETAPSSGLWDVEVCNLLWIKAGTIVTLNSIDYVVVSVDSEVLTFRVQSVASPTGAYYEIEKPFYFHGTPVMVNEELVNINLANGVSQKTPMIYLIENFEEDINYDDASAIDRTSDLVFCILDNGDYSKWLTDDFYDKAIIPMMQLSNYFVQTLKASYKVGVIDSVRQAYPAKFNIATTDKNGNKATTFSDKFSGVILKATIPFKRTEYCQC